MKTKHLMNKPSKQKNSKEETTKSPRTTLIEGIPHSYMLTQGSISDPEDHAYAVIY